MKMISEKRRSKFLMAAIDLVNSKFLVRTSDGRT